MTNGYDAKRSGRDWWGMGGDQTGCIGCGAAWWIIAAIILIALFFWGWGWPGWGGWGGWGWRRSYYGACPPSATSTAPNQTPTAPGQAPAAPNQTPTAPGQAGGPSGSAPGTGSAPTTQP